MPLIIKIQVSIVFHHQNYIIYHVLLNYAIVNFKHRYVNIK